jgi:hypothetical protein
MSHLDHGRGAGKAGHNDRRVPRELADIGCDGDVGLRQFGVRVASISKPMTRQPRSTKLRAIALPMMPRPTIPTVRFMKISCQASWRWPTDFGGALNN